MDSHKALINFFLTAQIPKMEGCFYSSNRGEANARLATLFNFASKSGLNANQASIVVASVGEITNNCFDHNSGFWMDAPGCVMSLSKSQNQITIGVADRGRGIIASLKEVMPAESDANTIMRAAFEKVISGRAPERRGNGLKFVRRNVESSSANALICFSNGQVFKVGKLADPAPNSMPSAPSFGTLTFLQWRVS